MKIKSEEEIFKEKKENWIKLSKIILFLEEKGLEIKECIVFKNREEYVKGEDLQNKLKENLSEICDIINKDLNINITKEKPDQAINEIYYEFKKVDLISKACREEGDKRKHIKKLLPYENLAILNGCNCGKNHEELDYIDHPKYLDLNKLASFDPSFYYLLNINRNKSKLYIYLFLIILGVLLYILLPIWPYKMKLAILWFLLTIPLTIIALLFIRVLIYAFFYLFGYDVWLFPDIEEPKMGFVDSFKRLFSVKKRKEELDDIFFRIFLVIFLGGIGFYSYKNPERVKEFKKGVYFVVKNIYNYGKNKFFNNSINNSTLTQYKNKKYLSLEDIDNL